MSLHATASQTVGPFFDLGLSWSYRHELVTASVSGERVELRGQVWDGAGVPIPDALLEVWQADAQGRYYLHPNAELRGFARLPTDASGAFELRTIKPGRVTDGAGRLQAPHLSIYVFMRGLLLPIHTRVYFPNEPANLEDPVLLRVPEQRRATLIAQPNGPGSLRWDVHMQGERETVCFSA